MSGFRFNPAMSSVDQFESLFNAASKTVFQYHPPTLKTALVVTDLEDTAVGKYTDSIKGFFTAVEGPWETTDKNGFHTVKDLLDVVEKIRPDLIVTYRHLHSEAWRWPYSLGEHLDVLIQVIEAPVAIMPHPDREGVPEHAMKNTGSVMAITDHLAGEDVLVNYAAHFTSRGGALHLTHIEDEATFERYVDAISKIPEIDTDIAKEAIHAQLLHDPSEYIDSCEQVLKENGADLNVVKHVTHGHKLEEHRKAVGENQVDLVVLEGHDADQLAMNTTAYSLAVELRTTPVLIV